MTQGETVNTTFTRSVPESVGAQLAKVDAELARRYPGDPGTRQPVHTVYVPADAITGETVAKWGEQALALLDEHAPDAASFGTALGLPGSLAGPVYERVRAKLRWEPVEDLRIDFEDGYGSRTDAEEDAAAVHAGQLAASALGHGRRSANGQSSQGRSGDGEAAEADGPDRTGGDEQVGPNPAFVGIRMKCMEEAVRERGIRTLDIFLTTLMESGGLPDGLVLTLPKVTYPEQVAAMAGLCSEFERAHGLAQGRLGFEIQIETPQSILGPDGRATVASMIDAAEGRATSLHYGTFDYSASCGVSAAYQAMDHPAADHAKAVMQVAAAGTGVRLSDGATNVLPTGSTEAVHDAWRLHHDLVRRSLSRAYYQGWDMHPGHLPTRYAAVYTFYREGMERAALRLAAYTNRSESSEGVVDEPATARALSDYLLRGLDCGALDAGEVARLSGMTRTDLGALAGRPTAA